MSNDVRLRVLTARDLLDDEVKALTLPERTTDDYTFLKSVKSLKLISNKRFKDDMFFYQIETSNGVFPLLSLKSDKLTRFTTYSLGLYMNNKTGEVLIGVAVDVNYMYQTSWVTYPIEECVKTYVFLYNLKFKYIDYIDYDREGYSIIGKELGRCDSTKKCCSFSCGSNYKNCEVWDGFMTSYFFILTDSTKGKLWCTYSYPNYKRTNK